MWGVFLMTENEIADTISTLYKALDEAKDHLDFCGYGDSYERECAQESNLERTIDAALKKTSDHIPSLLRG